MLTSATTVLERRTTFTEPGATIAYEAGWASEAIFFLQASEGHGTLTVTPEISPDSYVWSPAGASKTLEPGAEVVSVPLTNFGTWLRLRIDGATPEQPATVLIHLSLKG